MSLILPTKDLASPVVLDSGLLKFPYRDETVGSVIRRFGEFDLAKIREAWGEVETDYPRVIERLQPEYGPHTLVESIGLFHSAMKWLHTLDAFVSETKGLPGTIDASQWVALFREVSRGADDSLWVSGLNPRHLEGQCVDGVVQQWNETVSRFKVSLPKVEKLEDLERLAAAFTEGFIRLAYIRFANTQYAHLNVIHEESDLSGKKWLEPKHPVHNGMHLVTNETFFTIPAGRLLYELRDRFESSEFPYSVSSKEIKRQQERFASFDMDISFPVPDIEMGIIRDMIGDSIKFPAGLSPFLSILPELKLGKRKPSAV